MKHFILALICVPGLLLTTGCSSDEEAGGSAVTGSDSSSAEVAVQEIVNGIQDGRAVVVWQAMPAKYQSDTNELVRTFAEKMDPVIWNQIMTAVGSISSVLQEKQQFIVNHPDVQNHPQAEAIKSSLPHLTGLLQTMVTSLSDLEELKQFDGGEYLSGPGARMLEQSNAIAKIYKPFVPDGAGLDLTSLQNVKIETVSEDTDSATLKLTSPSGEAKNVVFTQVEDKWVPADMAAEWDQNMQEARAGLEQLPETMNQVRPQIMMVTATVPGLLAPLQAAETQEDFNQAVANLQGSMGMMMMQAMGAGSESPGFEESSGFEPTPAESESRSLTTPDDVSEEAAGDEPQPEFEPEAQPEN